MINIYWWIILPIYLATFLITILILKAVDWGKLMLPSEKNTGAARLLYLIISLGIASSIGTMIVFLTLMIF